MREIAEQGVRDRASQANGHLVIRAEGLDARLRLAECATQPVAFMPNTLSLSARQTVGVRCTQANAWTVYVSVALETELEVLVTRSAAQRGAHIAEADVERQLRQVPGVANAYVTNLTNYREQHLKRPLPPGTVLTADAFAADVLVKRGQQVTLVSSVGGSKCAPSAQR